jgi:hypothetical protein
MTATDEAPAVTAQVPGRIPTPKLNAALAKAQAEMPPIAKDGTGVVEGVTKAGKPYKYDYSYADLAGICAVAYPVLGKHGLSFSSQPTFTADGRFVLEYQLLHESGEQLGGTMPLPSSGKPQDLGSVLTYFKRYALTAVTGIAPGGEDNDAATANHPQQFDNRGRDPWEDALPAPRGGNGGNGNGRAAGRTERPAAPAAPAVSATEIDPDAQALADEAHEAVTVAALQEIHGRAREAHKLAALIANPATKGTGGLGQYMNWRKSQLEKAAKAFADLETAGVAAGLDPDELDRRVKALNGKGIEGASPEEMQKAAELILEGMAA